MADNAFIRILIAFLKHQVKKHIGDEAFGEVSAELISIGGDNLDDKLKAWLGERTTLEKIEKAAIYAQQCFHDKVDDYKLEQWMISLPLGTLPSVTEAIEDLPNSPDEKKLEDALRESIVLNWKNMPPEKIDHALNSFLYCIRAALLIIEEQREMVVGRSSLRTEEKVDYLTALFLKEFGSTEIITSVEILNPSYSSHTEIPEGTMNPDSKFYIERPEDKMVLDVLKEKGYTVIIKGPRQVGKSSLLTRAINNEEDTEKSIALLDFQLLDQISINNQEIFFQRFCSWLSDEINIVDKSTEFWKPELGSILCCTRYINKYVLPATPNGLLIAIDESERIFESPFRSDFFGMLRSWHNKRRTNSIWNNLSLMLVTSTEPNMFITSVYQSPFNVGRTITISDFTLEHLQKLNEGYGRPLTHMQLQQLMQLLGGQPYLSHLLINLVASGINTFDHFTENACSENSIFINHLQKHLLHLQARKELSTSFEQIIHNGSCSDEMAFIRLSSAGLAVRKNNQISPRCELYSQFFKERING